MPAKKLKRGLRKTAAHVKRGAKIVGKTLKKHRKYIPTVLGAAATGAGIAAAPWTGGTSAAIGAAAGGAIKKYGDALLEINDRNNQSHNVRAHPTGAKTGKRMMAGNKLVQRPTPKVQKIK